MLISKIIVKMIDYSEKNCHDINHFIKVHSFAKIIADSIEISDEERLSLEIASVLHDIACPLCRDKYGNTNGKYQEREGVILVKEFLNDIDISEKIKDRVVFLVGNHHTYENVDALDYQILLEADFLVNAYESAYSKAHIKNMLVNVFKTKTGINLLKSMYEF